MKVFSKSILASAIVFALAGCSATSMSSADSTSASNAVQQIVSAKAEYVRTVEGIEEYKLSNGMKVLLYPDGSQPNTLVNVTYRVGSVHEKYGETGMAHLLEHMLFMGSKNYPDIDPVFAEKGMRYNASTWYDRTNYYETFEFSEESLAWALGMEADRMVNATFTKEQLDSEMTVVRNEMERGENSPTRMLGARMSSLAYLWHNYGNSTIGARSDVENFPFDVLQDFYKKHYRPDNAVLTVAGRFDKTKTLAMIEETFGKIAQPKEPIEQLYTVEPTQDGSRVVNLERNGDVPVVAAVYHVPSALHEDTPAVQILAEILSDSARGRMQKTLVEPGIATSAYAYSFLLKDPSIFSVYAQGAKGKDPKAMEQAMLKLVEDIKNNKITADEVATAKASFLKSTEESLRNVTRVGMRLSEYIAMGDYRYIFYLRDLVEKVTVEDVQRVAEKYLIESNRTLGRFIPTKDPVRAEITPAKDISELLKDYKGRKTVEAGEVYDNSVANILARLQKFEWENGAKVQVYPKKLRAGEVHINMVLPTGNADELLGFEQDFKMLGSLMFTGSNKYSKELIASKLDALKATVRISSAELGKINVSIKGLKENLNETIAFVQELLLNPKFDEAEIAIAQKAAITRLEMQRSEPNSVASRAFGKAINASSSDNPLANKTIDEEISAIKAVSTKRLKKLHSALLDFSNGQIAVVGDVEPEAISNELNGFFGDVTGTVAYDDIKMTYADPKGLRNWIETPDKANAMLLIGHTLDLSVADDEYPAAYIANRIFGGGGFASRLMQRIRVKEGYSYGTGSQLSVEYDEAKGSYVMYAIAAPENMKNVVKAYDEEVQKVLDEGFTEAELKTAIEGALKSMRVTWSNEGFIAGMLNESNLEGRELQWYEDFQKQLQAVTLDEVHAAFKKHIYRDDINIFAAGDWAKVNK